MSQPTPYNRVTSFTTDQAQGPATPLNGANIDAEFNGVKVTLDQLLTNIAVIQRDDTHLANQSVGIDQLDTTVLIGFNPPTAWVTDHDYVVTTDSVFSGQKLYRCLVSHHSGTFATDLAAGKWVILVDFSSTFGTATNVTFTPAQGLASTNVQAAIVESKVALDDLTAFRTDISGGYTTTGTSTAYALATGTPFASLAAMSNQPIVFIPHTMSGAAATLAVDGLTAKKIRTSTGADLTAGALMVGTPYLVVYYNAVGEFLLVGYSDVRNNITINGTLAVTGVQTYTAGATFNGAATFNSTAALGAGGSMAGTFTGTPTFSGNLTLSGKATLSNTTAPLGLSGGTTAQRSGGPTEGDLRYNTTLHGLEYWNGSVWIALGQQPTVQRIVAGTGATYTPATGVVRIRVRMVGPGGGGGAVATNAGSSGSAATSFQVNSTGTAWAAAAGSGGSAAGGAPGNGGSGGADGSTGVKVTRVSGGTGGGGASTATANTIQVGGFGGSTPFGLGPTAQQGTPGAPPANSGAGGGGGGGNSGTNTGAGGGGGEYVEFWATGVTTATYTVGTGGAGGAAGTNAGRAGADGQIIIEEFYS